MRVAVEQSESSGGPRLPPVTGSTNVCVSQMKGTWCGPEKMGPVRRKLVSASDSLGGERPLPSTVSVFLPSDNPVTSPRAVFGVRPARKELDTLRPFKLTINDCRDWLLGKAISIRTSPPLTRSGEVESVLIVNRSCPWLSSRARALCEKWIQKTSAKKTELLRNRIIAILLFQFVNPIAKVRCRFWDLLRRNPRAPTRRISRLRNCTVKTQRAPDSSPPAFGQGHW